MTKNFYCHGKLLLTSEYLVLDGAKALAVPTTRGQKLQVKEIDSNELRWKSILEDGTVWMEHTFSLPLDKKENYANPLIARLYEVLITAQNLQPGFLANVAGYEVTSTLEFPKDWGLGSSSTLIVNIATWANVDPYYLLQKTFGGSGYDIACATSESSIIYQKLHNKPTIEDANFIPNFTDKLFFVHLNRKQNSRESIEHYRSLDQKELEKETIVFSEFTENILTCTRLADFEKLLTEHENRLAKLLKTPTIKCQLFSNYPHTIKSLGGWGGDFILAIGSAGEMEYFRNKGFQTIVAYNDMVLG